ncbi:MAG: zinc ribbon-containing (seleno)protein DG [Desulforhopalus sp.]
MFLKFFYKKKEKDRDRSANREAVRHGIDLDMNYCPLCGDEYRPEIATCVGCNIDLIGGAERLKKVEERQDRLAGRSMELLPNDELIAIRRGLVKEIKSLQKLLAAERIPSLISGDEKNCTKGCCGPELYLLIRKEDTEAAAAVLTKDFIKSTALEDHDLRNAHAVFDQQAAETVCPACGCRFSPTVGACPECGLCFE